MARPKVPLISKRKALEVALEIIDNEGIAALSIRRLADRLNVNGASLYHHFAGKDEIVLGAARLALEDVVTARADQPSWRAWVLTNARRLRDALRAHPDLVPIMLRRHPLAVGGPHLDESVVQLRRDNVPEGAIAPMMEALALYAIGCALNETWTASSGGEGQPAGDERYRHLASALRERALSSNEIFDMVCEKIIDTTIMKTLERGGPRGTIPASGQDAPQPNFWATA